MFKCCRSIYRSIIRQRAWRQVCLGGCCTALTAVPHQSLNRWGNPHMSSFYLHCQNFGLCCLCLWWYLYGNYMLSWAFMVIINFNLSSASWHKTVCSCTAWIWAASLICFSLLGFDCIHPPSEMIGNGSPHVVSSAAKTHIKWSHVQDARVVPRCCRAQYLYFGNKVW